MSDRALTDLELERWLAGDLSNPRTRVATKADRVRLEELRAEHAALLSRVDVAAELAAIDRRRAPPVEPRPVPRWRWALAGCAGIAAVAAVLVMIHRLSEPIIDDGPSIKGGSVALVVHVARGSAVRRVASGDTVHPGDRVRFEVGVPARGYIAILGIDGSGSSMVYYPFGSHDPAAIDPSRSGLLPGAIALDATPGDERFYLVYAEHPFPINVQLFVALRNSRASKGLSSAEVVVHKTGPPDTRPVRPR